MTAPAPEHFERDMRQSVAEIEAAMLREGIAFTADNVAERCRRMEMQPHQIEGLSALAAAIIAERGEGAA